jgi:hypothetical protein
MSDCPARRTYDVCTYGPDFGPCDACYVEDHENLGRYSIPIPDYAEARAERMAAEIRKLQAAVKRLSAAERRAAK